MSKESDPARNPIEPDIGQALPPELAQFLRSIQLGAVFESTDLGTGLVIKAPRRDIEGLRGVIPIHLRHELHRRSTAPVIRTVIRLYDRPKTPLTLETMTNIADPIQRAEFAALEAQESIYLHFYDEDLRHPLSKCVGYDGSVVPELLALAQRHLRTIQADQLDFERAKAEVMVQTQL